MTSNHRKMIGLVKSERFLAVAVKNRAEQAKLEAELANIDREKKSALRQHNVEQKKFKSKYSKSSKKEEIYEPYYAVQRNSPEATTTLNFELIHSLIFTNGEVDIEKILCLHLICAHRSESLTPPKRRLRYLCKAHSPSERLIERSKSGFTNFERLAKLLPLFTIELVEYGGMGEGEKPYLINDGRLASRILINEKVMQIINTVATTLEQSNPDKFRQLLLVGNNPSQMRKMLGTKRIAEFLETLFDNSLINSCESYALTPPFRIRIQDLDVRTNHGNLEHLISQLRENVLQQPPKNEQDIKETAAKRVPSINDLRPKMENRRQSDASAGSSKMSAKLDLKNNAIRRSQEEDKPLKGLKKINYIARNIQAAGKTRKIEYDTEEHDLNFPPRKRSSSGSWKTNIREPGNPMKNLSLPTVEEKASVDEEFLKTVDSDKSNPNESDISVSEEQHVEKKSRWDRRQSKYHIKETTCPACMERWKKPLPSPKTPRVKKSSVLPDEFSNNLKTNSHHRISMMINQAMYNLESYDRRYSAESEAIRSASSNKREIEEDALDSVYLNPMDLAKIEQEIKEKETQKKLENFLKGMADASKADKQQNFPQE